MSRTVVLSRILLFDAFSLAVDKLLWYMTCGLYCAALTSEAIPSYSILEVIYFADMSDYPVDDVSVFVQLIFNSLTVRMFVFGEVKSQLS